MTEPGGAATVSLAAAKLAGRGIAQLWRACIVRLGAKLSSADLSVEIYRLVTRAVGGEPIDVATLSEELAARYAHLGLSAQLIGKAIARAAGMVGITLDDIGEAPPPLTGAARPQPAASGSVNGFHANGTAVPASRHGPTSPSSTTDAETAATPEPDRDAALRRIFIRE